jgi:membrane protease YdiL (CAAX protease family)
MAFYVPVLQIGVWLVLVAVATVAISMLAGDLAEWKQELMSYLAICVIEVVMIAVIFRVASKSFVRGLKGFGLNVRTASRDFFAAMINFVTAMPLVVAGILLAMYLGQVIVGPEFELQSSEGLVVILKHEQLSLRLLLLGFVIIVVPVFEEVLFRGLLQSMIRGFGHGPWEAIFLASAAFAVLHPVTHWPALFVLAGCMGYAYEKSGSLFRPIFIHAFFNAASVTAALLTG